MDERFSTPRGQGYSSEEYATPRPHGFSSDGEFATPRPDGYADLQNHSQQQQQQAQRGGGGSGGGAARLRGSDAQQFSSSTRHSGWGLDAESRAEAAQSEAWGSGGGVAMGGGSTGRSARAHAQRDGGGGSGPGYGVAEEVDVDDFVDVNEDQVLDAFSMARHSRVDKVAELLDRGIPVNIRDMHGNTLLIIACQNNSKKMAKCVLRRGADINARNFKGNTGLHFAYQYGYGETLGAYLISKGADPTIRNNNGRTCVEGIR